MPTQQGLLSYRTCTAIQGKLSIPAPLDSSFGALVFVMRVIEKGIYIAVPPSLALSLSSFRFLFALQVRLDDVEAFRSWRKIIEIKVRSLRIEPTFK